MNAVEEFCEQSPDTLDDSEYPEGTKWVAYHYRNLGYEGVGQAVVGLYDGSLWQYDLGHCSCYGPMDEKNGSRITPAELAAIWGKDGRGQELTSADDWNDCAWRGLWFNMDKAKERGWYKEEGI